MQINTLSFKNPKPTKKKEKQNKTRPKKKKKPQKKPHTVKSNQTKMERF